MTLLNSLAVLTLVLSAALAGCSSSSVGIPADNLEEDNAIALDDGVNSDAFVNAGSVDTQSEKLFYADPSLSRLRVLRIQHHMVECEAMQVTHCLLTREGDGDEWQYFYDSIEGFNYRWGTEYEILVAVQDQVSDMPGASRQHYSLIEVISETTRKAGDTFHYTARNTNQRITETSERHFSLLGNKEFTCSNEDNCNSIRSAIEQDQSALLTFQHVGDSNKPLVLEAVLCSDADQSFNGSCL